MKTVLLAVLLCAAACGTNARGERCNPARATSDCDPGLTCVFPTKPTSPVCGTSFCCIVDSNGVIVDSHPHCKPDVGSAAVCGLDLAGVDLQ